MAVRVSRRKLAQRTAVQLHGGSMQSVTELAAFLVDTGRTREADLIARDIEVELAKLGTVVVTVTSAQQLTDDTRKEIVGVVASKYGTDIEVRMKEIVDSSILGGVIVRTPREELDASVSRALANLKASKIKE